MNDVKIDMVVNGQGHGSVANALLANGFDPRTLRPYIGNDGVKCYRDQLVGNAAQPVFIGNANATLRKDEWKLLDEAVIQAAKERLRIVADLRAAGLTYTIPNGMGTTVLQTEAVSDITAATVSMEPARKSEGDRPEFSLVNLPLPIIHKDFHFSARQIATGRNMGAGIDVTTAQLAARRVVEAAEDMVISGYSMPFGSGNIYGLTTHASRNTKVLRDPRYSPWTPKNTVDDVLAMRSQSQADFHYGPWVLYTAPNWDQYLDADYSTLKGDNTLRERLEKIQGITAVRTLDHLSGYQMILVQMTSDVIRMVMGMDVTTVQWSTDGGMIQHFKVMAMMVPQVRADHNGNCGVVHGNVP